MNDSTATINEAIQLVEDRLASRVSIVFSRDFLEEFPSSAQTYFNEGKVQREYRLNNKGFQKAIWKNKWMMMRVKMILHLHYHQHQLKHEYVMINGNIDVSNKWEK